MNLVVSRSQRVLAAGRAASVLEESTPLVWRFLLSQQGADGGFLDRNGRSDLYYTGFGLDGLIALSAAQSGVVQEMAALRDAMGKAAGFLRSHGDGDGLDFTHLCCLARAWGAVQGGGMAALDSASSARLLSRIEAYRASDGGYHPLLTQPYGTAYAAFLALGAYADLGKIPPATIGVAASLNALQTPDGAWTNERGGGGATNATAAALAVLAGLGQTVPESAPRWLLARAYSRGGFAATPNAPIPDLLSTATALHSLASLEVGLQPVREGCLDFVDSLWSSDGGFFGHWADDRLDCEYAFYGLLALGELTEAPSL